MERNVVPGVHGNLWYSMFSVGNAQIQLGPSSEEGGSFRGKVVVPSFPAGRTSAAWTAGFKAVWV